MLSVLLASLFTGCAAAPVYVADDDRTPLDRKYVEYPAGFELREVISGLTAPTAVCLDENGILFVSEGGLGGREPRITGYRPDGSRLQVYPPPGRIRAINDDNFRLFGPVGGLACHEGELYVSHRDRNRTGVITAYDCRAALKPLAPGYRAPVLAHRTVVADLPAVGDYAVTGLAIHPSNGRVYFGVGAATNSGVVGVDNWATWAKEHRTFSDASLVGLKMLGYRFDTPNPADTVFTGDDVAVTGPFSPFNTSVQRTAASPKPTAAIYSVNLAGGDLRVEAHGIRRPMGLAFNDFGNLFATNQGMELRGTRPVQDDPDALLRVPLGAPTWFGWPDFSADFRPVYEARFQPPIAMLEATGYPELSPLIDHSASGLVPPDRDTLMRAVFPSLSGAAGIAFVPYTDAWGDWRGRLLVALSGDRAPFATSGHPLKQRVGFKVVAVDLDVRRAEDFVFNTARRPASELPKPGDAFERPIDLTFSEDGRLYIVDLGQVDYLPDGRSRPAVGTGRVLELRPAPPAGEEAERPLPPAVPVERSDE